MQLHFCGTNYLFIYFPLRWTSFWTYDCASSYFRKVVFTMTLPCPHLFT